MAKRNRYETVEHIKGLDPEQNATAICHLLAGYEFPWDITRALELALLRTFCIPSIAERLDRTGEFACHTQKRYDDTGIIVSELFKWGYHHSRGQAFLERMNAIHQRYLIANTDYLYVLSTFIYEPIRWIECFGWRSLIEQEKLALYIFWREVGIRMGIEDIPASYQAFEEYNQVYEQSHFAYRAANQRVADATQKMLLEWFPRILRPQMDTMIPALLDQQLLHALGWQPASPHLTALLRRVLRVRSV